MNPAEIQPEIVKAISNQRLFLMRCQSVARTLRHRLEIELSGVNCRRNPDRAEEVRVQINECFEIENEARKIIALTDEILGQI